MSTEASSSAIRSRPARVVRRSVVLSITWLALSALPAVATNLTGVVIDPSGDPAAGVTVRLSTSYMMQPGAIVLSETATDAGGHFRVAVPGHWFDMPGHWRQDLCLTVQTPDRGSGGIVVWRQRPLPRHDLTIQLQPWTKRKIALRSHDNKPLAGVCVKLTGLLLPVIYPPRYSQTVVRLIAWIPEGG